MCAYFSVVILFLALWQNVQAANEFTFDFPNRTMVNSIVDFTSAIPIEHLTIAYDESIETQLITEMSKSLQKNLIATNIYYINDTGGLADLFDYLIDAVENQARATCLFLCKKHAAEDVVFELYEKNLIQRRLLYLFYWGQEPISRRFVRTMHEALRIVVITNPREDAFRVYYNQATSHRQHNLQLVNWWIARSGLYKRPALPSARNVYDDFKGKVFHVPVVHKPPWHFVNYEFLENETTIRVEGGRDDKLLAVLAAKLNFQYIYYDPPDRSQGSAITTNGSFKGVLGLIWRREAEFFLGDVAITLERSFAVEFSFPTLADSGAFITHSPGRLNEALALIRPFHWQVWPLVIFTVVISGPILYGLITMSCLWRKHRRETMGSRSRLFKDCVWFTATIFLRQTGKEPSHSSKARFFTIILSFSATYVIGDMYSANLTSLLARPGRDKPINTMTQLEDALVNKGFELYVERHSSYYTTLENGTGIYGRLWALMQRQKQVVVDSVEKGVKMVRDSTQIAVIAGRETLFFDSRRFGATNFYLSEKLNTGYSAIAFQYGCPYIDNFNRILMRLFEAGILTKMTEDEYEKLGKKQLIEAEEDPAGGDGNTENADGSGEDGNPAGPAAGGTTFAKKAVAFEEEQHSEPIRIAMLQGAFLILILGEVLSTFTFVFEIIYKRNEQKFLKRRKIRKQGRQFKFVRWWKKIVRKRYDRVTVWTKDKWNYITDDVSLQSFNYYE